MRLSNFELLRVFSMLLIVFHHAVIHNSLPALLQGASFFAKVIVQIGCWVGPLGNNLFILVSSYFLCQQKNLRIKSILSFLVQCSFFSLFLHGTGVLFFDVDFSMQGFVKALFWRNVWWFVNTYLVFALLTPFIARMLTGLDQRSHFVMLVILTAIWCFKPSVFHANPGRLELWNVEWFIYLFLVVSYIRNYPTRITDSLKACAAIGVFACCLWVGVRVFFLFDIAQSAFLLAHPRGEGRLSYFSIVLLAFAILGIFKNMKPFRNSLVNVVGATTFGIYLIHEHPTMKQFIWREVFDLSEIGSPVLLLAHLSIATLAVFGGCSLISYAYLRFLKPRFDRLIELVLTRLKIPL